MSTALIEDAKKRTRRPKARNPQIVMAALQERLNCIPVNDENSFHLIRVNELLDELARGYGSKEDSNDE